MFVGTLFCSNSPLPITLLRPTVSQAGLLCLGNLRFLPRSSSDVEFGGPYFTFSSGINTRDLMPFLFEINLFQARSSLLCLFKVGYLPHPPDNEESTYAAHASQV